MLTMTLKMLIRPMGMTRIALLGVPKVSNSGVRRFVGISWNNVRFYHLKRRPTTMMSAVFLSRLAPARSFKKIQVTSPLGRRFLRLTKAVLKGILLFYAGIFTIGVTVVTVANYYINQYQQVPLIATSYPFSFDIRLLLKLGLYNELVTKKLIVANEYYMVFLRYINREHGLAFDKDLDSLPEYLSNGAIADKGKPWYDLYIDVLWRTALVKGQLGHLEDAKSMLQKAKSFVDDVGSSDPCVGSAVLRNNGCRLLAKIYELEDLKTNKENVISLYHEAITALIPPGAVDQAREIGSLDAKDSKYLTRDLYNTINELAVLYAKIGEQNKAFKIFVNNLLFLKNWEQQKSLIPDILPLLDDYYNNKNPNLPFSREPCDIPKLKFYISEILWAKKQYESAINWTKEALVESYNFSRQDKDSAIVAQLSVSNLITMYKKLNKNGKYEEKIKNCETVASDIYIPTETPSGWKILFENMI